MVFVLVKKINFFVDIKEFSLNEFFKTEDRDFTPWLQENIELLGSTIGIDIGDTKTEVSIGNYRLDVLAYESGTDRKIAIENQYGTTNHTHLGQLITYMAGINAEVVVWIAENFNKEHITAINHLNQISNENIAFFCIRPRIIKIGDSEPALEFIIIAQPDEWEKQVKSEINITEREKAYKKFWEDLITEFKKFKPHFERKPTKYSYLSIPTGHSYVHFEWLFRKIPKEEFNVALHFENPEREENLRLLKFFNSQKKEITNNLSEYNVKFDENFSPRWTHIYIKSDSSAMNDKNIKWAALTMNKFYNTLRPILEEYYNTN